LRERGAQLTILDTGDYYAAGHDELLIGRALSARDREAVAISLKFGLLRAPDGSIVGLDGRPAAVKSSLAYTSLVHGVRAPRQPRSRSPCSLQIRKEGSKRNQIGDGRSSMGSRRGGLA
jgi:hypothetical protein